MSEMPIPPSEEPTTPPVEETSEPAVAPVEEVPPAAPEPSPPASETPPPAGVPSPEEAVSTPRGRARTFLRRAVTWLLGLFIVFAGGYLLAFFTLYQPLNQRFQKQGNDLTAANQQVESLQADIERLNNQIADLQARLQTRTEERDALQGQVDASSLHFYTLRALVDVQGARLALASEDAETAQVYLAKVPAYLEAMQPLAAPDVQETLLSMQQRLTLALDELKQDPPTAVTDLAILADWLRQFESTLW